MAFGCFLSFNHTNFTGGVSMIPEVYWGVGGSYLLSDAKNYAHNSNYVQNTFFQILAILFIILTILLYRIVYLL